MYGTHWDLCETLLRQKGTYEANMKFIYPYLYLFLYLSLSLLFPRWVIAQALFYFPSPGWQSKRKGQRKLILICYVYYARQYGRQVISTRKYTISFFFLETCGPIILLWPNVWEDIKELPGQVGNLWAPAILKYQWDPIMYMRF